MADSGDYVVPMLAGEPYVPRPPLAYMGGALAIKAFSPPLQIHNAARLIAGVALTLVLLATALASRELNGRAFRWLPVLILVGSVGFWDRAHVLSPELFLTVGIAVGLYGFALALRRPVAGGVTLGAGIAIAFLGRGFIGPFWLVVTALLLPACGPEWRNRAYAATVITALCVAFALALPWPLMLHARDPALFASWWHSESPDHYLAMLGNDSAQPLYYLRNLVWFAWPSLPLILWLLWLRGRGFNGGMAQPGIVVPGVLALVILGNLLVMPEARLANALALLVPLALLAALEVDSLKRGFSGALDWFGILSFGLVAVDVLGLLDRFVRQRDARSRGAALPRYRSRLQAVVPSGLHARRGRTDGAVDRAGAARAPFEPARDSQLGGRRDAHLGTGHDDLAALPRFAPQLSLDGGECRDAAAVARLPRQPQSRRTAARALRLFRRHPDGAGRDPSGTRVRRRCWFSTGVCRRPRNRRRDGRKCGAAAGAATTPSASCCT